MEKIEFKEIIELFLHTCFRQIKDEVETPNINFSFLDDVIPLFKEVKLNPFVKEGCWTPDIEDRDIEFYKKRNHDDVITIYINDSIKFFEYLKDITNAFIELNEYYGVRKLPRETAMDILRRIWLRMGIDDILNVERFLDRQLQFIKNRTFDTHSFQKVDRLNEYDIYMKPYVNKTWDETSRSIYFSTISGNSIYHFPRILYDIDDNNVCYIYGVQDITLQHDKRLERVLYKLNKGIENPNVHPSKVYSLLLFINELKKKNISRIVVPSIQILSYHYHELISQKSEEDLSNAIMHLDECPNNTFFKEQYELAKMWYDNTYEKQDKISFLKTEELFNLMYRITIHDSSIEITNEVNIEGDSLNIKIR